MLGQFLIMLREGFEAALIISIIFAYFTRIGRRDLSKYVWYGISLALFFSVVVGGSVWSIYGSLQESIQVLFEGAASWLAVVVLTYMIFWMAAKGSDIRSEIQEKMKSITLRQTFYGLILLGFIVVFREGLESVLFLLPFLLKEPFETLVGSFLGGLLAVIFAYIVFTVGMRINIRRFFYFTSLLLVFLAGGLLGYGTHELIEYLQINGFELGWIATYAYTLNIPNSSIFHHKGAIGSLFAVMFGYTVNAEWARLIIHLIYLGIFLPFTIMIFKDKARAQSYALKE